jgi:hypothetical protein
MGILTRTRGILPGGIHSAGALPAHYLPAAQSAGSAGSLVQVRRRIGGRIVGRVSVHPGANTAHPAGGAGSVQVPPVGSIVGRILPAAQSVGSTPPAAHYLRTTCRRRILSAHPLRRAHYAGGAGSAGFLLPCGALPAHYRRRFRRRVSVHPDANTGHPGRIVGAAHYVQSAHYLRRFARPLRRLTASAGLLLPPAFCFRRARSRSRSAVSAGSAGAG